MGRKALKTTLFALIILFLIVGPLFLGGYWVRVLTTLFMYAILAGAWNIVGGYCGYPSFGNVAFFGLGAYTTCILMVKIGMPFYVGILAGGVISCSYSILLGFPILRLKGHYFAVATLGVAEATRELVINMEWLTKGSEGISLPMIEGNVVTIYGLFYYAMFLIMAIMVLTTLFISKNRIGFAFRAIRSDEEAASTLGINTTRYKVTAWAISAFFTGIVGGIYAYWSSYISPEGVFATHITVIMLIMTLLGGPATVLGPVIGAFCFELLSEAIWSHFVYGHTAILGAIIILIVVFLPGGLMKLLSGRFSLSALIANVKVNRI
jgi:branched-chain amino acid transport system permease protein